MSDCSRDGEYYVYTFADTNITKDISHEVIVTTKAAQGDVIVRHVDEEGTEVAPTTTTSGDVGTQYSTSPVTLSEYDLKTTPDNATGTRTRETITVTYVYALKPAKVIVNHISDTGETLAPAETINGKYFDSYTTSEKTFNDYRS